MVSDLCDTLRATGSPFGYFRRRRRAAPTSNPRRRASSTSAPGPSLVAGARLPFDDRADLGRRGAKCDRPCPTLQLNRRPARRSPMVLAVCRMTDPQVRASGHRARPGSAIVDALPIENDHVERDSSSSFTLAGRDRADAQTHVLAVSDSVAPSGPAVAVTPSTVKIELCRRVGLHDAEPKLMVAASAEAETTRAVMRTNAARRPLPEIFNTRQSPL